MDIGYQDPLCDEVDEARRQIYAECGNDLGKLVAFYMEYQEQYADRLISRREHKPDQPAA